MRIALYEHAQDTHPATEEVTWAELVTLLSVHRVSTCTETPCVGRRCGGKNGPAWSPVEIEGRRLNDNVRAVTAAVFDLDHIPESVADDVIARVQAAGYGFVVYSTHSNNVAAGDCCLRLVLQLSRPALPREWPTIWRSAVRQLQIPADEARKDLAGIYYLPDAPEGTEPIAGSAPGAALDVDALLEAGRAGVVATSAAVAAVDLPAVAGDTDLDALRRKLRKVTKPESREFVRRLLAGEPIAPVGKQDTTLQKVTGLLSFVLPPETPEDAVIELMRPSLQATDWQDGYEHLVEQTRIKYRRNLERRTVRDAEAAAKHAATLAKLGRTLTPAPSASSATQADEPAPEEGDEDPDEWMMELIVKDGRRLGEVGEGEAGQKLKNCEANVYTVLQHAPDWRGVLRMNDVEKKLELHGAPLPPSTNPADGLDVEIAVWFQRTPFGALGLAPKPQMVRDVMMQVARANAYDPLRDYLEALRWDGRPRLDTFLGKYLGAQGDPAHLECISPKWFISAVARALRPGCKVDTVLILEGPQGLRKSTAFRILGERWFCDATIDVSSKDSAMLASQYWILELAELDTFRRSNDQSLKAFLSRNEDTYRPPYGRTNISTPRRCVMVGTTNADDYLQDPTGHRRNWPVLCTAIDIEALKDDRDQLWAEAVARFHQNERWWLSDEEAHRAELQARSRLTVSDDGRREAVLRWFLRLAPEARPTEVTLLQAAMDAFGLSPGEVDKKISNETSAALVGLGFTRHQRTVGDKRPRVYRAPEDLLLAAQTSDPQKPHLSPVKKSQP